MKRITECFNNPGNGIGLGVTNHYTPIDNIIINVRNFFGSMLGINVQKAEDGCSLKITSSQFSDKQRTESIIYNSSFDGHTKLGSYIMSLGLPIVKMIEIGGYYIVYFCPKDMPSIANPDFGKKGKQAPVKEMKESLIIEAELTGLDDDDDDDMTKQSGQDTNTKLYQAPSDEVELVDKTHDNIVNIVNNANKIEAAADLEKLISSKLQFPENVYIRATKDIEGHESIALRWKFEKKRPFGGKIEQVVSLLNIYNAGANAIWVGAFDESFQKIPEDIEQFIYNLLDILGTNKTSDVEVYDLPENAEDIKKDDKEEKPKKDKKEEDAENDEDDNKSKKDKDDEDDKEDKDE